MDRGVAGSAASAAQAPQNEEKKKNGVWARMGGSAFAISLLVHGVFIILAIFFLYKWIAPPVEKVEQFVPGGGGGGNNGAEASHKIQKQMKTRMAAPSVAKRIMSSSSTAAFALPENNMEMMDSGVPMDIGNASAGTGGGAGGGHGTGIGTGVGSGSGPGSGPGNSRGFLAVNPFGSTGGIGLVGTFYDFKRDSKGNDTGVKALNRPVYTEIINGFTRGSNWGPPRKHKHFTSETKLTSKVFAFKGIPDTEAGKAFQCPETGAGIWVAHYSGSVKVTEGGKYRLVGWGDNCLVVGVNGKVVLDASDVGYTGEKRESMGSIDVPGKPSAQLFQGEWFNLREGQTVKIDVVMGDEGGIFSATAMIEKEGTTYSRGPGGMPLLPVLMVADLDDKEKPVFNYVPAQCLKRTVFQADKGGKFGDIGL